jgi:hypothetical protein
MKPRARIGAALLLLGGCGTTDEYYRPDVLAGLCQTGPRAMAADRRPADHPAETTAPVYVVLATPGSPDGVAAQAHVTLPAQLAVTAAPAADRSAVSVANSAAKEQPAIPAPVQRASAQTLSDAHASEVAAAAGPESPSPREPVSLNPEDRPALNDVLQRAAREASAPKPLTRLPETSTLAAPGHPRSAVLTGDLEGEAAAAAAPTPMPPADDKPALAEPKPAEAPCAEAKPAAKAAEAAPACPESSGECPAAEPHRVSPAAAEVRLVNSKHISLNYEVKGVGPSGITDVELWCTRDGRTWKKLETLHQKTPPCVVDVADEDLYGFTLVVRTGAGLGKAPQEGDPPQVWVEVDTTRPTVRLLGVEAAKGSTGRQLTIRWKAADKNMAARPITLTYAAQAEGPWLPVAGPLENTGHYVWQVPAEVPHRLFLRVEAADQVGNVGSAQTPDALLDDTSQPTVSILQVESTTEK